MTDEQIRAEFEKLERHFTAIGTLQALLSDDPVGKFLNNEWVAACTRAPALSERESAERLVQLANAGRLPLWKMFDLVGGAALGLGLNPQQMGRINEALLERLRGYLAVIAERAGPPTAPTVVAARGNLRRELSQLVTGRTIALPTYAADDGAIAYRILAIDTPDAIAFATLRILTSPTAELLCRCRYRECRQFFLVDPPRVKAKRKSYQGRLRREYCVDEHRIAEQKLSNVERQRKLRANRKKNQLAAARRHK